MKEKLMIIGASGHGKVVADIALKMNVWSNIQFLDDDEALIESMGIEVVGKSMDAFKWIDKADIFVAIGDNKKREKIHDELETMSASIPVLVHPNAVIGTDVSLDIGTVVMAGSVINCCSTIGKGCIINTGATIDHDNIIEDFVHVSPGVSIAGNVKIGKNTWLGIGSIVINNVEICDKSIVGAGAIVNCEINEQGTYVGIPARRIYK